MEPTIEGWGLTRNRNETYKDKYPKATDCLSMDRKVLLAFYDFPAADLQHIRITNPIESTFATVTVNVIW